jgi:hypothetical protein
MVLDMEIEEEETPIIVGRPFLNTTNVVIYIGSGQVHFQFPEGKVRCYFNSYTNYEQPKKNHNRSRQRSRRQANQPLKDGWADYSGEVSRYEDRWNEWDTQDKKIEKPTNEEATQSDSATQTTQVWRKKITSTSTLREEQASDSSAGSDDGSEQ